MGTVLILAGMPKTGSATEYGDIVITVVGLSQPLVEHRGDFLAEERSSA